mgnify:CR=1 FL=1
MRVGPEVSTITGHVKPGVVVERVLSSLFGVLVTDYGEYRIQMIEYKQSQGLDRFLVPGQEVKATFKYAGYASLGFICFLIVCGLMFQTDASDVRRKQLFTR